jgi:hypothetical protein
MSALFPSIDPEGLIEYSVVYTDRSLNHMSQTFQRVMNDISSTLKQVYNAHAVAIVPGSGTFGMEAVARQLATGQKCLVIRNGWFSYRWTQILEMGAIAASVQVLKARPQVAGPQAALAPAPLAEVLATIAAEKPQIVFAPTWKPPPACSCLTTTSAPWPTPCMRSAACSYSTASPPAPCGWICRPVASTC